MLYILDIFKSVPLTALMPENCWERCIMRATTSCCLYTDERIWEGIQNSRLQYCYCKRFFLKCTTSMHRIIVQVAIRCRFLVLSFAVLLHIQAEQLQTTSFLCFCCQAGIMIFFICFCDCRHLLVSHGS